MQIFPGAGKKAGKFEKNGVSDFAPQTRNDTKQMTGPHREFERTEKLPAAGNFAGNFEKTGAPDCAPPRINLAVEGQRRRRAPIAPSVSPRIKSGAQNPHHQMHARRSKANTARGILQMYTQIPSVREFLREFWKKLVPRN
jgi:hypothetical protein